MIAVIESGIKNTILTLANNKRLGHIARRYGRRFGVSRFIAGESLTAAVSTVRRLNRDGLMATLDVLGESVTYQEQAVQAMLSYLRVLKKINQYHLRANVSLKLTALGLDLGESFCYELLHRIVTMADQLGIFVRIDMEDSGHLPATLEIFRKLRQKYENVGTVIQAYLYRSEEDVLQLQKYGANLRFVKGAYREPPHLAFPDKADVDDNFRRLIRLHLDKGLYTAIATHDEAIIGWSLQYIKRAQIQKNQYEFQMLYGIRPRLQRELSKAGHPVRVYVPFGQSWYPYFMRRLAERPENIGFVVKNLLRP